VGPTLAQDLTSETFLQSFRGRGTFRAEQASALPWLYGIATNQVRGHLRSEQHRIKALGQVAGQKVLAQGADEHTDDALAAAATLQCLGRALAGVTQEARDVLALVAVEGLSYEEVAAALDIPVGTVRSRLSRVRRDLRRAVAGSASPSSSHRPLSHSNAEGACHGR